MTDHRSSRNRALLLTALRRTNYESLLEALPAERAGEIRAEAESMEPEGSDLQARWSELEPGVDPGLGPLVGQLKGERPAVLLVAAHRLEPTGVLADEELSRMAGQSLDVPPLLARWIWRSLVRTTRCAEGR